MTINKKKDGNTVTYAVEGRLETITAPELEKVLKEELDGVTDLVFDFEKLDYISSAGLRVILYAQKRMNTQGTMKIVKPNEIVSEIFDVTGFTDILTIE